LAETAFGTRDPSSFALSFVFSNSSRVTVDASLCLAELLHLVAQRFLNRGQLVLCEAKVPPKTDRTVRAVQFKDGLVPVSDHVDMRRSVVVRVHDTQARKPQDGGPRMIAAKNLKTWVTDGRCDITTHEQYPELLAEELIDPEEPRKWILVAREIGVPSEGVKRFAASGGVSPTPPSSYSVQPGEGECWD